MKKKEGEYIISMGAGQLIITTHSYDATVNDEEFRLFRLCHGWPVQGIDYTHEMLLNINMPEYISWDKGCFLGQEIVARVHFKAKPPKKLIVCNEKECDSSLVSRMTSITQDPDTGRVLGFVFVPNK